MKQLSIVLIFVGWCIQAQHSKSGQYEFDASFELLQKAKNQNNTEKVLEYGKRSLKIARQMRQPALEGKVYVALGNYYYQINESSSEAYGYYHHAYDSYGQSKDTIKMAKTLLRMAILEKNIRNYLRAKQTLITALEFLKEKEPDYIADVYNELGIVYDETGNLQESIRYHELSLKHRMDVHEIPLIIQSINNMATAYKDHKQYEKSGQQYRRAFREYGKTLYRYPEEYARLIDNQAHLNHLIGNNAVVLRAYLNAKKIREDHGDIPGIITSELHISEYFRSTKQYSTSNQHAERAYKKAFGNNNFRDALASLYILGENARDAGHLRQSLEYHIRYNSLLKEMFQQELSVDEKFADIRYAASQKEKENKNLKLLNQEQQLLAEKREKHFYISLIIFGVFVVAGFLYIKSVQAKQKQKEQRAQQEILKLLYEKRESTEKTKKREQERIANDLHDSVASKLSGLMLKIDTIAISSPASIQQKLDPVVDQTEHILKELKSIVHDMNDYQVSIVNYPHLIQELVERKESRTISVKFTIDNSIDWNPINNRIKLAIYYIVQQARRNLDEHSQATEAYFDIGQKGEELVLTITDNGVGIDTDRKLGMGIPGMQRRVSELGGKLLLTSIDQIGTKIQIIIPIYEKTLSYLTRRR